MIKLDMFPRHQLQAAPENGLQSNRQPTESLQSLGITCFFFFFRTELADSDDKGAFTENERPQHVQHVAAGKRGATMSGQNVRTVPTRAQNAGIPMNLQRKFLDYVLCLE